MKPHDIHSRRSRALYSARSAALYSAATPPPFIRRAAALVIAICAVAAHAETVQIASAADWAAFAKRVNTGEGTLNATLVADVSLGPAAPRVGTDDRPFRGDFNGGGNELSVNWIFTDTQCAAPFASVQAAKIHDLRVTGSIVSDDKFAAGLVGRAKSETSTVIERCRVSVAITLMLSGEASCGGFIGVMSDSTACRATIRDCLFDGSLIGPSANGCGGFVGWKPHNSYLYLYSCLFAPKAVTVSAGGSYSATFSRSSSGSAKIDGQRAIYYQRQYGLAQGADASAMSAEDLAAALGENWAVSNGKAGLALFPEPPEATTTGFAYQGVLRDAQGLRLEQKEHTVEFRLYENATGGEALWGRSYPVLLDTNGLFNVALSDKTGSAIADGTPSNGLAKAIAEHVGTPLYLGLRVVSPAGAEISPRQKLLAVPVATMALDATAASGNLSVAGKVESSTAKIAGAATAATFAATNAASVGGNLSLGGQLKGPGSFPVGAIVLWHGSAASIPDGWKLCDGQNGTPDLRDRFVVGAGHDYAKGDRGGEKEHQLSENQLPQHRHEYVGDDALAGIESGCSTAIRTTSTRYDAESSYGANCYSYVYGTSYVGDDAAHENRPPFYALCYIMRVR